MMAPWTGKKFEAKGSQKKCFEEKKVNFSLPFSSTSLVTYSQTTRHYIPKDSNLNIKYCSEIRIY
jgi:hypothetical protein